MTGEAATLVQDTQTALREERAVSQRRFSEAIEAIATLWARLARSSQFADPIAALANYPVDSYPPWSEVQELASKVYLEWRGELAELVWRMQSGPCWSRMIHRVPALSSGFGLLGKLTVTLDRVAHEFETIDSTSAPEHSNHQVHRTAGQLHVLCTQLAKEIRRFFVNPIGCSAVDIPAELASNDGRRLQVRTNIDYNVPRVFTDLQDLNDVCVEMIANWRKHASGDQLQVMLTIRQDADRVCLEFADTFLGGFNLDSAGGLGIVRRFCDAYGVELEVIPAATDTGKAIALRFPNVPAVTGLTL